MRTALVYKGAIMAHIQPEDIRSQHRQKNSRGFTFTVSGAASEEEHISIIEGFQKVLQENGYQCDGFGSGTWEENVKYNSTKEYLFLSIPVKTTEEKEYILRLYNDWKAARRREA